MELDRRNFLKILGTVTTTLALPATLSLKSLSCSSHTNKKFRKKVIVLGIDGMDPNLLKRFIEEGVMPNFKEFIKQGSFSKLGTTYPPQSPVAWSSFITGTNPGKHGIFDFIHRNPQTLLPYFSISKAESAKSSLKLGEFILPISKGDVKLLRKGRAFWEILDDYNIESTVIRVPVNFPPVKSKSKTLSGLGTPDILGTYGTFSYYTEILPENKKKDKELNIYKIKFLDNVFQGKITGPKNIFRKGEPHSEVKFSCFRDPQNDVVKIFIEGKEILLKKGEWSDWIRINFEIIPYLKKISGICRFYLKDVHPYLKLYITPVNLDPKSPAMPICTPEDFSKELSENVGLFYTQGLPSDTKALSSGIFNDEEYIAQTKIVLEEQIKMLDYELNRFNEGFLFFYFSNLDQDTHMMWRTMDEKHPQYKNNIKIEIKDAIKNNYKMMDNILKRVLSSVDKDTTLIVLSDHGFAPFYKEVNINSWLLENGFITLQDDSLKEESEFLNNIDWKKTKAYAIGLNSIYLNIAGREKYGILNSDQSEKVLNEIKSKLELLVDPETGQKVISHAYKSKEIYKGECTKDAPDIIVGYSSGYRISDEAGLGKFQNKVIKMRTDKWSGDHCIDPLEVPGVFIANREIKSGNHNLCDLAPTILSEFGIKPSLEIEGKDLFLR